MHGDADLGEQDDAVVERRRGRQARLRGGRRGLLAVTELAVQAPAREQVRQEIHLRGASRPVSSSNVFQRLPILIPLLGGNHKRFHAAQILLHELHRVGNHERLPQYRNREEEDRLLPRFLRRVVESEHAGGRLRVCVERLLDSAQGELARG